MRKTIPSILLALLIPASAADLLNWDLTSSTGTSGGSAPASVAPGVTGSAPVGGGTTGNSTSPAGTWNRTFTAQADFTAAQTAGNFFSFSTSADPGYTVTIDGITGISLRRTSSGPNSAGLFYSTDNITFTQTGTTTNLTDTNFTAAAANFSSTLSTTPLVINGGETIYWRIVVYGGTGNRLGISNANPVDFTLTGSSVPDVAAHNLLWTGSGGSDWNTTPANTNWADTDLANAPAPFVNNDNVTIDIPATITVDAGGVSPGNMAVSNTTGTVSLAGGPISGLVLTKSAAGTLSIDGSNTFSGGSSVTGGILQTESNGALGSFGVSLNGATLATGTAVTNVSNNISCGTTPSILDNDFDVEFSGQFVSSGAGIDATNQITKTGAGILTLSQAGSSAFGSLTVLGSPGGMLELDVTEGGLVFTGTGQRSLGGTSTWDAPATLAGGTLLLHGATIDGSGSISVTASSKISARFNFGTSRVYNPVSIADLAVLSLESATGTTALIVHNDITGLGSVTKTGNGYATLVGSNSYSGNTIVEAGTLRVGSAFSGNLGGSTVTLNIGTSTGTLDFRRSDTLVVPQIITGNGNVLVNSGVASSIELTGDSNYLGTTGVNSGTLRINGDNSAATGLLTVADGGFLGGNGSSGASVTLQSNGGLAPRITDWTGPAGTGYDDLAVSSLDAGSFPIKVAIDTTGLVNFTESPASFTILNTSTGITGLVPGTVTVTAPGFPGTGTWALAESVGSLILSYTPATATDYDTWSGPSGFNLTGGPTDDDDLDGLANKDEYAFGLNPTSGSSVNPISTGLDPATGVFKYTRRNTTLFTTGLTYSHSWSTTLASGSWTPFTSDPVETSDNGNPTETITVTVPSALLANDRLFIQVTAE